MAKPKRIRDVQRAARAKKLRRGVEKAEAERAAGITPLYDDGRRYNGYQCDPKGGCGGIYLTVDLDKGATPMFMPCLVTEGCEGMAVSLGYPRAKPPAKLPLLVEWYEPLESSMALMSKNMEGHVRQGGLLRRPTDEAPEWVRAKLGPVFPRREETKPTQLTLILGDDNGTAQESSDHVHQPSSEGEGGEGADPSDSGQG